MSGEGGEIVKGAEKLGLFKALGGFFKRAFKAGAEDAGRGLANESKTLMDELAKNGIKHSPENIVRIARDASGKIVFLEKGTSRAGLAHILEAHGAQFAGKGITEAEVPDLVMDAVTKGTQVGMQRSRPIYEVFFKGEMRRVAVSVGDNGFIVGANIK